MAGSLENRGKLRELIDKFQFIEMTKYTKLHRNNQQAGGLITRLPAFFDYVFV